MLREMAEEIRKARVTQINDISIPPHFSTRITILFLWMWLFSVTFELSVILVPCTSLLNPNNHVVLLCRRIFVAFFGTIPEIRNILLHRLELYGLILTVLSIDFAEKTTLPFNPDRRNIKRALGIGGIRLAKWMYLVFIGGIIIPLLCGTCFELYVKIVFNRHVSPRSQVEIAIGD